MDSLNPLLALSLTSYFLDLKYFKIDLLSPNSLLIMIGWLKLEEMMMTKDYPSYLSHEVEEQIELVGQKSDSTNCSLLQ